jgi:hypothetical protein
MSDDPTVEEIVEGVLGVYDRTPDSERRALVSGLVATYEKLYRQAERIAATALAVSAPTPDGTRDRVRSERA